MLLIIGKYLGHETRTGGNPGNEFDFQEVTLQTGEGVHTRVERVRLGRDFVWATSPAVGDEVAFVVGIRAYAGRNGAGYGMTAWEDATLRVQVAATV